MRQTRARQADDIRRLGGCDGAAAAASGQTVGRGDHQTGGQGITEADAGEGRSGVVVLNGEGQRGRAVQRNARRAEGLNDDRRSNHRDRSIGGVAGSAFRGGHLDAVVLCPRRGAGNVHRDRAGGIHRQCTAGKRDAAGAGDRSGRSAAGAGQCVGRGHDQTGGQGVGKGNAGERDRIGRRIGDGEGQRGRAVQRNARRSERFSNGRRSGHAEVRGGGVAGAAVGGSHVAGGVDEVPGRRRRFRSVRWEWKRPGRRAGYR